MEKLIELLNEYSVVLWDRYSGVTGEEYPKKWSYGITGPDNPGRYIFYSDNTNLSQTYLISKEFGFIKWLVDNDKIKKSYFEGLPAITKNGFLLEGGTALIMLLSISSTPIEDLISYLK